MKSILIAIFFVFFCIEANAANCDAETIFHPGDTAFCPGRGANPDDRDVNHQHCLGEQKKNGCWCEAAGVHNPIKDRGYYFFMNGPNNWLCSKKVTSDPNVL